MFVCFLIHECWIYQKKNICIQVECNYDLWYFLKIYLQLNFGVLYFMNWIHVLRESLNEIVRYIKRRRMSYHSIKFIQILKLVLKNSRNAI